MRRPGQRISLNLVGMAASRSGSRPDGCGEGNGSRKQMCRGRLYRGESSRTGG